MLQKLVEIEQNRLKALGYDSIVTPVSVYVSDSLQLQTIGNDTYILTGIRISKDDVLNDMHELTIVSPTESIQLSQQEIATLGTSILKTFKEFIIIKTTDENEFSADSEITPFRMDFVKISPIL
jgi:hypothetical protein